MNSSRVDARSSSTLLWKSVLFLVFFISGFCALLYQTVWLRLAFAAFGIITPVISVLVSVFMLGLSLGSWLGGKYIDTIVAKTGLNPIFFYAFIELITALSAPIVPLLFAASAGVLLESGTLDSANYLFFSACLLALSILPWCVCMGATFPLAMSFVKTQNRAEEKGFSFLYLANVIGSAFGSIVGAGMLIELLGFQNTLWTAAAGNIVIVIVSVFLGMMEPKIKDASLATAVEPVREESVGPGSIPNAALYAVLFTTGFASMAMEIAWVRSFLPVLGHAVYAFAAILFVYLWATALGAYNYRIDLKHGRVRSVSLSLALLAIFSLFPVIFGDPQFHALFDSAGLKQAMGARGSLLSIAPFCLVLGYLTPQVIDVYSRGTPSRAGFAYAINILGCIIGPLIAGYVLLPWLGARDSLILLTVPFIVLSFLKQFGAKSRVWLQIGRVASIVLLVCSFYCHSYEEGFDKGERRIVRRDQVATVVQTGSGQDRRLYVNGVQMTALSPVTKEMAHIPNWIHEGEVQNCLGICFGMGTTFRSQLSHPNVDTTWVELVPSVKAAFDYYFEDTGKILKNPKARIIVDDGRRYLQRKDQMYDIITVDAPPPPEGTGIGLLFSDEFYKVAKKRLKPDGIMQVFVPAGEKKRVQAQIRSIADAFPYVRVFNLQDVGYDCSASMKQTRQVTADEAIARMPESARRDLTEWLPNRDEPDCLKKYVSDILAREVPLASVINPDKSLRITDDRPFNEYFILRETFGGEKSASGEPLH